MIINKNTSDAVLVSSLRLFDADSKVLDGVEEFNTETLVATLSAGGSTTAAGFEFHISDPTEGDILIPLLEAEDDGELLLFHVKVKSGRKVKKALDPTDTAPQNQLVFQGVGESVLVRCTNCGTNFLVFKVGTDYWSVGNANPADKWMTATKVDDSALTCDNCSESVVLSIP